MPHTLHYVCRYEHAVYVLDALIYFLTNWSKEATSIVLQSDSSRTAPENVSSPAKTASPSREKKASSLVGPSEERQSATFFQRSDSVIFPVDDPICVKRNQQFFDPPSSPLNKSDLSPLKEGGALSLSTSATLEGGRNLSQPLMEACALAQQPHLLKPHAKKEDLFRPTPSRIFRGGEGGGGERGVAMWGGRGEKGSLVAASLPLSFSHLNNA